MRWPSLVFGITLMLSGLVWVAQGLNLPFAPPSFMTAERGWVLIGAIAVAVGVALVGWSRQRDATH